MATPQSIRYLNAKRALNTLFRQGGRSRADLARSLGLNRSSTGSIVAALLADDLVVERPEEARIPAGRTGRSGVTVALKPEGAWFLGVEIETDRIGIVVLDLAACVVCRQSVAMDCLAASPEAVIDEAAGLVRRTLAAIPAPRRIGGVCATIPGLLTPGGVVRFAPILRWRDVPLKAMLRSRLGGEIAIRSENDANAFAIAETYRAAANPADLVVFLLIESGVGGGIVVGGELLRGSGGAAGEFGHLKVGADGFVNQSQRPGHLENYIGREAMLARYRQHGGSADSTAAFFKNLARDEAAALTVAREWGHWLAEGLLHATNLLNPRTIVLGGSLTPLYARVGPEVEAILAARLIEGVAAPGIEISSLGEYGAAVGGACIMHQRFFAVDEQMFHFEIERAEPRVVSA